MTKKIIKNVSVEVDYSPVAELYFEDLEIKGERPVTVIYNDIFLLLNQQRLKNVGIDTINNWIKGLSQSNFDTLSELKSKCTDEQLLSLVKSRRIQSRQEMSAWLDFLVSSTEGLANEIATAQIESNKSDNDSVSDSSTSSSSNSDNT